MPRYRALLIGNSRFALDATLQGLEGPVNDVVALRNALTDPEVGLFAPADVRVLPERGAQEILIEIQRFLDSATRDDLLLLYYSGHGVLDNRNQLFLCAADTRTDVLRATSVGSTAINSMIADSAARTTVIVLDCCHSGAFKGGDLPAALAGIGRFVLTSCRGGELAADTDARNGTSLFTTYLVDALSSGGSDPNRDGYVSLDELYEVVLRRLSELIPRRPLPQRDFSGVGDVAIARRPRSRPVQPLYVAPPPVQTVTPAAVKAPAAAPDLAPAPAPEPAVMSMSDWRGRQWRIPAAVGAAVVLAATVIGLFTFAADPACVAGGQIPLRSETAEQPCSGTIANPGQVDRYRLTAVGEETLFFDVTEGCAGRTFQWRLTRAGVQDALFDLSLGGYDDQCQDYGPVTLKAGEYELSVSGINASVGGYGFTVYDATPQQHTLTVGDTVEWERRPGEGRIESPGGTDVYRLTTVDQQTLYFDVTEGCVDRTLQWRLNRVGVQDSLFDRALGGYDNQCQDPEPVTLGPGDYELSVSGIDAGTGGYGFTVYDATPQQFTLTVGDTVELDRPEPGAGRIESPGATDVYRLTTVDQQTLHFDVTEGCVDRTLQWRLTRVGVQDALFDLPLGDYDNQCQDPEPVTLGPGEYELSVSGTDANVGGYRFQIRPAA